MMRTLAILLIFPLGLLAQSERRFFVEGGTCINGPFKTDFTSKNQHNEWNSSWQGKIESLPSYYIKAGLEPALKMCGKSQVAFPFSLAYYNTARRMELEGFEWGCFSSFKGQRTVLQNSHSAAYSLGIKFISDLGKKLSFQRGINFGQTVLIAYESKIKDVAEGKVYNYDYKGIQTQINCSLGAQVGLFYKLNSKTQLGLVGEYLLLSKRIGTKSQQYHSTDYLIGFNDYANLLSTGLRIQHSF